MTRPRFHLAFPVHDLEAARAFYGGVLGCPEGREDPGHWIDFDLMDHQIVAHLAPDECARAERGEVDGKQVPVRHFGLLMDWDAWEGLRDRLKSRGARFLVEPYMRFTGKVGEQATMFVEDPSGNALEFKAFRDDACVFQKSLREETR